MPSPSYSLAIFHSHYGSCSEPHFILLQFLPLYPSFSVPLPFLINCNLHLSKFRHTNSSENQEGHSSSQKLTVVQSLQRDFARPCNQAAKRALVLFLLDFSPTSLSAHNLSFKCFPDCDLPSYYISKQRRAPSLFSNTFHHFF